MTFTARELAADDPRAIVDRRYIEALTTLSEGSVRRHFDPYIEIDWDAPEFEIVPNDRRWILPADSDPFGGSSWYRELPVERKIEIGMWRQANIAKVGLQFENVLIRGLMQYAFIVPNGSAEFRYCTHEAIEEGHHTLMFQEVVNRIGVDVPGMGKIMRVLSPLIPMVATTFPEWFFTMVLAGEEPIDYSQKNILRGGDQMHPLIIKVMSIHVAEEARHISFAHEYLMYRVPQMSRIGRFALGVVFPFTMRRTCNIVAIPPRRFRVEFGIPRSVMRDVYWRSPRSRTALRDFFADARMLAEEIGLMNKFTRFCWKLCGIDGPASRYRSQPVRHAPVR
ncbi:AurF N-oxygenase family protein [Nocardia brasiliensis]